VPLEQVNVFRPRTPGDLKKLLRTQGYAVRPYPGWEETADGALIGVGYIVTLPSGGYRDVFLFSGQKDCTSAVASFDYTCGPQNPNHVEPFGISPCPQRRQAGLLH
jgi:hypothetical protein